MVQSTFRNIVSDELKRVLGSSTTDAAANNSERPPEAHDVEMLWNYETMTARAPSELAEEDYVELMQAMERTLYDDLLAEMMAQGSFPSRLLETEVWLFLFWIIMEVPNGTLFFFFMCTEKALLEDYEAAVSLEDDAIADLVDNFQELSAVHSNLFS